LCWCPGCMPDHPPQTSRVSLILLLASKLRLLCAGSCITALGRCHCLARGSHCLQPLLGRRGASIHWQRIVGTISVIVAAAGPGAVPGGCDAVELNLVIWRLPGEGVCWLLGDAMLGTACAARTVITLHHSAWLPWAPAACNPHCGHGVGRGCACESHRMRRVHTAAV